MTTFSKILNSINKSHLILTINISSLLIISGCLFGSLQKSYVKAYLNQMDIYTIVFYQYFFGFILYLPRIIKSRFQIFVTPKLPLIALRALLGVVYWLGAVLSLKYISLLDTSFLMSLTPLWVPLSAYLFFSEKIESLYYVLILLGLLGVGLILTPDKNVFNISGIPAIVSSFCWALAILITSKLTQTVKIETILVYYFLFASLILAPVAFYHHSNLTIYQLITLAINGGLMVLHQELINKGYSYPKAYNLSILTYTNIMFSGLLGILFFNETPNLRTVIGMFLVFYSCFYVTLKYSQREKNAIV